MGGMGSADGQPRHYSSNIGGSVMLEADHRAKQMGEQTTTGICSPISHHKLDRCITSVPFPQLAHLSTRIQSPVVGWAPAGGRHFLEWQKEQGSSRLRAISATIRCCARFRGVLLTLLVGAMLLCTNALYICHLAISRYYSDVLDRG